MDSQSQFPMPEYLEGASIHHGTIEGRLKRFRATSGFDYMRVILAVSILCLHSIPTSYGMDTENIWTWGSALKSPARLTLCMFFALSGFLVTGSVFRSGSIPAFIGLRVVRLVPALAVETLLSGLVLGGLFTTLTPEHYFSRPEFWKYFLNIVGEVQFRLPGVFENLPAGGLINSSIWTIPYELQCYFCLILFMITGLVRQRKAILYITIYGTLLFFVRSGVIQRSADFGPVEATTLVICFLWGVTLYLYAGKVRHHAGLMAASLALALLLLSHKATGYLAAPFVAYATIYLGLLNPKKLFPISSGDYSYGIYIYAFPIQQTVAYLLPAYRLWWLNILISLPVTFLLAAFSWHCVEKYALRLRSFFTRPAQAH